RRCLDDHLGRKIAARPRAIFDDKLAAELFRQPLPHQARANVVRAARGVADNDVHRPCRVIECRCGGRQGRQRGSACYQMQKTATGELQGGWSRELENPCPPTIISKSSLNVCFWHKADISLRPADVCFEG